MEILCLLAGGVLATASSSSSSSLNSSGSTALSAGNYREVNVDYDDVADADVESMMEEIEVHVREMPYDARPYDVDVDVDGDQASAVDNRMDNVCKEKLQNLSKENDALRKKSAHAIAQKLLWKSLYGKKVQELQHVKTVGRSNQKRIIKMKEGIRANYTGQSDTTNTIKMYKWMEGKDNKLKVETKNVHTDDIEKHREQGWDTKINKPHILNTKQSTLQQKDSKKKLTP